MKVLDRKSWDFVCSQVGMDGDFTYDVYISGSVAGFQYTYVDDKMVCIYMADDNIPMIHIGLLYVKEKHRKKGLATNFINKLIVSFFLVPRARETFAFVKFLS